METDLLPGGAVPAGSPVPLVPTAFFGRETEQADLIALLLRDETRLVTLVGSGGIGKTRLSVAVAQTIARQHAMDICFVDLTQVRTAERMLGAIADALELESPGIGTIEASISATLNERSPLLMLDNLEQIEDAAPAIDQLLSHCPGVTFLATSRKPLRLRGEYQFTVPPLLLPGRGALLADIASGQFPAIDLFADRARTVQPNFVLTEANLDTIRSICERVDGLPLAIELAASRLRIFSPADLLAHLQSHLSLLSHGPIDLPERQQTIQQTIAWSTELLSSAERRVLERCSIFEGSFTIDAAIAICAPDGPEFLPALIADLLTSLLDQSLIQAVTEPGSGTVRFRLFQTVRDFSSAALAEAGQTEDALARHSAFFLALAASAEPELSGPDQVMWLQRMEAEHDNFRTALALLIDREDSPLATQFVGNLWPFWYSKGHISEGQRWLERVLSLPGAVHQGDRAKAFNGLGALCSVLGDEAGSQRACEEAVEIWRAIGDRRSVASGLNNLAVLAEHRGDYPEALRLNEQALQMFEELRDRFRSASVISNIAVIARTTGDLERARALGLRALGIRRSFKDKLGIASSLHNLGTVLVDAGELDEAARYFEEASLLFAELDDPRMLVASLNSLGAIFTERGDLATSNDHYRRAQSLAAEIGESRSTAIALQGLGMNADQRGDAVLAMTFYRESLEANRAQFDTVSGVPTIERIANLAYQAGDFELAVELSTFAEHQRKSTGFALHALSTHMEWARAELGEQRYDGAIQAGNTLSFDEIVDFASAFDPRHIRSARAPAAPSSVIPAARDSAGHGLTEREIEVLRLITDGKTNADIGRELFISPFTAKTHVANLLGKLNAESRAAAATWAVRHGYVDR